MSFVKGQTTWANIVPKLIALACGEVADDAGDTVRLEDRWIRMGDIADNGLRTHKEWDLQVRNEPNRSGYFNCTSNALRWNNGQAPGYIGAETDTFIRATTVYTAGPANLQRWFLNAHFTTPNTTANDYSTARVTVNVVNADSGQVVSSQNNLVPAVDGTVAVTGGLTLQIGNPVTGIVQHPRSFWRLFSTDFLGGIDWWPYVYRASGPITFGTRPGGTEDTDWEIVGPTSPRAIFPNWVEANTPGNGYYIPNSVRHGWGLGLGVKTTAGLTGGRYTVSWDMSRHLFRMYAGSGGQNGQIFMQPGLIAEDVNGSKKYGIHGSNSVQGFLKPFNVPGSVDPNAPIQYWMRVTSKCLVIVLNADPGFSGTSTSNWVIKLDEYPNQEYPSFNVIWGQNDFNGRASGLAWALTRQYESDWCQSHIKEGARDYQTGWMRTDIGNVGQNERFAGGQNHTPTSPNYTTNETNLTRTQTYGLEQVPTLHPVGPANRNGSNDIYYAESPFPGFQSHPDPVTGKWFLYSYGYSDGYVNTISEFSALSSMRYRGFINCGVYYLPGFNWANGDELEDQAPGGRTFFLFGAENFGSGIRGGNDTIGGGMNRSGGIAIAQD